MASNNDYCETPTIFIGSSSEALPLAKRITKHLASRFQVTLWSEAFELGDDNLSNLLRFGQIFDFAVLVITNDDQVVSRHRQFGGPRDNVLFELGIFMGALGKRRSFYVVKESKRRTPKIPTDLSGVTSIFLPAVLTHATLKGKLAQLIGSIEERKNQCYLGILPSTGLATGYFHNFIKPVCNALCSTNTVTLSGKVRTLKDFSFTILLPRSLSEASHQGAQKYAKKHKIEVFQLPGGSSRAFPFYVSSQVSKGKVAFYDFPTTLRASHVAVDLLSRHGPYVGQTKMHKLLDQREIANFERTLRALLDEPEAAQIKDKIRIIRQ